MMELDRYNQSFEEHVDIIEEEADNRLRSFRQQCVRNFINNFTKHQLEWDAAFRELLFKSQEIDVQAQSKLLEDTKSLERALNLKFGITDEKKKPSEPAGADQQKSKETSGPVKHEATAVAKTQSDHISKPSNVKSNDPFPKELGDYFTNNISVKEFIQIQQQLETNRQQYNELLTNPSLKPFKNDLNLFIRTQINSISNSDREHLNIKTRMLARLFSGEQVIFQERPIQASGHPSGQLYAMDLAAQTFVTVGARLVNSVPAIAKSMAIVINDIISAYNMQPFRGLVLGNLQERCPYLVPFYPELEEFSHYQTDSEVRYKIACGYAYDSKAQTLESDDKFQARMRSMVLIYACILSEQADKGPAWTWLASFLSLEPKPVISATILQAFLQETSKSLSHAYGRQYRKLLEFIKTDYVRMIERVTPIAAERQSLIKLKNLLSDARALT